MRKNYLSPRMRYLFNFLIIVLLLFCLTSKAFGIEKINITKSTSKEINFEIKNNNPDPLRYTIYSVGWHPWILFSYSQIFLKPGETKNVTVFLVPDKYTKEGSYNITLVAASALDKLTKEIEVTIFKEEIKEEKKLEIKEFLFDNKKLTLILNSKEELNLKLEIYKENNLLNLTEEKIFPGENKVIKYFDFEPGNYLARVSIYKDKELIYSANKSYFVPEIKGIVKGEYKWNYLIVSGSRIVFENKGVKAEKANYSVFVKKSLDSFFIAKGYKEKIDKGDKYKYLWEFVLLPNQKYVISYSYNYSVILILFLIVIFFFTLFYLSNRKEIKIKKLFTKKVHFIKEEKEIKICLEIINRTSQELHSIVVEDFVQPIFKLKKEFQGLRPSKIVKIDSEKKLVWEIPKLEPKETRILMYKIVPKIGISEKYSFSLAKVKYKKDKLSKVVFSNKLETDGK